ncbi:MAG: hypothetical protein J6G98_01065 [Bacilli bacterium]|nr:hypothetical protein [Bacilli bacterium]
MNQINNLKKNIKEVIILDEVKIIDDEISLYQDVIDSFPKGSLYEMASNNIIGLYGISKKFNFNKYLLDKKQVFELISDYNMLIKRRVRLSKKINQMKKESFLENYILESSNRPKVKTKNLK